LSGPDVEIGKEAVGLSVILQIKDLTITVYEPDGERALIQGLSFDVPAQSIVSLVGGSGSGKTTTGLAILRLLPSAIRIKQGEIIFRDRDLLKVTEDEMRQVRGREIGMVFQEPLYAFNPVFSIGYQIDEVLKCHTRLSGKERRDRMIELLRTVGFKDPQRVVGNYPHQLSGGMRQRAMIAQAIAANPVLLLADEPTSNLDVTLQARIMELFRKLRDELKISILLITHDLGVVSHLADETVVLSEGRIVERGPTKDMLADPKHLFTNQLISIYRE
jgi:ABC-type dipeptide/oligopeptide/nickel transport system ATPase component